MPRPIQAQESFTDLEFPLRGVDVSSEYGSQPPGTTPTGENVRASEVLTGRGRGGSRPGLSRYLDDQPDGANLIQLLDYVVDPTVEALSTSFDPLDGTVPVLGIGFAFGGPPAYRLPGIRFPSFVTPPLNPGAAYPGLGGFPDPSTNNNVDGLGDRNPGEVGDRRMVRTGGSGISLNRNTGTFSASRTTLRFVQANWRADSTQAISRSLSFNAKVQLNSLIFLAAIKAGSSVTEDSVTDSNGNTWTLIDQQTGGPSMSLWWAKNAAYGDLEVEATFNTTIESTLAILEYSGQDLSSPIESHVIEDSHHASVFEWTTDTITVSGNGRGVLGVFGSSNNVQSSLTPKPGFKLRVNAGTSGTTTVTLAVLDRLGVDASREVVMRTATELQFKAQGVSVKPL